MEDPDGVSAAGTLARVKRVAVLGATGSIGTQTLDIIARHPTRLQAVALAAARQAGPLQDLARQHEVSRLALFDETAAHDAGVPGGIEAIVDLATAEDVDLVVVAVAGVIGLKPTLAAIRAGKAIALASKEVLVAAGEVVMPLVREHGTPFLPIDSEHSAIFQCLQGAPANSIEGLILTASGGPFRGKKRSELEAVSVEQALNHPTWRMGGKITVDSATLMNKGLETIEARWLFDVPLGAVDVVVHPQSIVHSLVRFQDGSTLAQAGWPDMRIPIQYALLYPERVPNGLREWNPLLSPALSFEEVDHETFPSIQLAIESARRGGTTPCALNAANEEAANAFLRGEIGFLDIARVVEKVTERHSAATPTLDHLLETDRSVRVLTRELMA